MFYLSVLDEKKIHKYIERGREKTFRRKKVIFGKVNEGDQIKKHWTDF